MDKKLYQIGMDPVTHRRLKAMAALKGLSLGEMIEALLKLSAFPNHYPEPDRQRFFAMFDTCCLNTGSQSKDRVARRQMANL